MKKKIIEFKDFNFKYRVQAEPTLKNINLTIYEGEKVLIVGPSGSGKSTLAHCLNGLVPFFYSGEMSGELRINNEDIKNKNIFELSKVVGTVLQDPDSQFIGLTVGEDIAFKLENYCVEQNEMIDRVNKAAKLVDIDKELEASPYKLSGGQKQRVTLAGVTVDEVKVLLFDEPLASLDPATGKSAMELIDSIQQKENKTMVIIEHRLEDVLHCKVDRIVVMDKGCIVADTTPNELLSTNILEEVGVREPLYITALKYSGCEISKDLKPESINTLDIEKCKDKVNDWYENTKKEESKTKNDYILELDNINFSYSPEKQILKDVSFKIRKGDIASIVGKNGAGKSTISKLICGFYKPTSGRILFDGKDIKDESIKERSEKIGFVMQNPNQMISKTMVFDEVAFGLKIRGYNKEEIKEKVENVLKTCGLYGYRNWPISALSFGQKKRVTIASILVLNPEVIILDEPTAGQDFKHYTEIMEFLVELNKKGVTIIMVTHDMHLMLEYTSNVVVLSNGQKIGDDKSTKILTNKEIIEKANLKETSLQELAIKCKIKDSVEFVNRFIDYDRRVRNI
ncbi:MULTISPECIES: ABC transporter ATP-binding protein [Romboutsia]|uniref:Energy-coupling factor transporter ATP-binding protein EcfA 1 n=1 Tax=Romboutsia hominis TaxID=1507512 RepID=A0A2P2BNM3_9FIRM|nr:MULTISPECIES: ABC transporter ATP-binding protein [Romboutsia]MCH1959387.1 ABC transporter ATP-binding protein [Romboutsia hominis]MCH1970286.1 ABC transporter ATP-binding protein [Romboutsia hominis]MDB8790574.1 ABC transporter ATP-binding protein [Romboutsia sp. 1001216sp1]MDB8803157.1 ABC transporter ATP-binding protein [Romboutsia sp. 1001216sp1]MDB8814516.1 ABC transporter ATP-binding protein [Romboutsia sp. 1001216sp1]